MEVDIYERCNGFLATVEDGKPRVRPFAFMLEEDGKLFFCTNNQKNVYKQLQDKPEIEFSSLAEDFTWIRLNGKVKFSDDIKIKEKIIESNEQVKSIYKTAGNPIFEIFYLEYGTAVLADFSGEPPRKYEF